MTIKTKSDRTRWFSALIHWSSGNKCSQTFPFTLPFTSTYPIQERGAEAFPSCHKAGGSIYPGQLVNLILVQPIMLTDNSEALIKKHVYELWGRLGYPGPSCNEATVPLLY